MPVRIWIALMLLCSATAGAEPAATPLTTPPARTTLAQLDSSLMVLDSEQERWCASAQAREARAHQAAMEAYAARRTELLLQRCRVLGDAGRATSLEGQLRGVQPAQPLPLERQLAPTREARR